MIHIGASNLYSTQFNAEEFRQTYLQYTLHAGLRSGVLGWKLPPFLSVDVMHHACTPGINSEDLTPTRTKVRRHFQTKLMQ
jgi:hypothetical protein